MIPGPTNAPCLLILARSPRRLRLRFAALSSRSGAGVADAESPESLTTSSEVYLDGGSLMRTGRGGRAWDSRRGICMAGAARPGECGEEERAALAQIRTIGGSTLTWELTRSRQGGLAPARSSPRRPIGPIASFDDPDVRQPPTVHPASPYQHYAPDAASAPTQGPQSCFTDAAQSHLHCHHCSGGTGRRRASSEPTHPRVASSGQHRSSHGAIQTSWLSQVRKVGSRDREELRCSRTCRAARRRVRGATSGQVGS